MKLKEFIDELGKIVDEKKKLDKKEKEMKSKIKKLVEQKKLKIDKYTGKKYEMVITKQETPVYDKDIIIEIVGVDTYIENSKPDITSLKKNVGEKRLEKAITGASTTIKINIKEKK